MENNYSSIVAEDIKLLNWPDSSEMTDEEIIDEISKQRAFAKKLNATLVLSRKRLQALKDEQFRRNDIIKARTVFFVIKELIQSNFNSKVVAYRLGRTLLSMDLFPMSETTIFRYSKKLKSLDPELIPKSDATDDQWNEFIAKYFPENRGKNQKQRDTIKKSRISRLIMLLSQLTEPFTLSELCNLYNESTNDSLPESTLRRYLSEIMSMKYGCEVSSTRNGDCQTIGIELTLLQIDNTVPPAPSFLCFHVSKKPILLSRINDGADAESVLSVIRYALSYYADQFMDSRDSFKTVKYELDISHEINFDFDLLLNLLDQRENVSYNYF